MQVGGNFIAHCAGISVAVDFAYRPLRFDAALSFKDLRGRDRQTLFVVVDLGLSEIKLQEL